MAYFESLDVGINVALDEIFNNQNLCKYLYYNEKDPSSQPTITNTTSLLLLNVFPLPKDPDAKESKKSYLNIYFMSAQPYQKNSGFKKTFLCFDIICHLDIWLINEGIRPLKISAEIDRMFNNQYYKDLSTNNMFFVDWSCNKYSDYFYGYHLTYALGQDSNTRC